MSKAIASKGWVRARRIVPVVAVIVAGSLVLSHAKHQALNSASRTSVASQPAASSSAERARIQAGYAALPLAFEQNQGQTDSQVKYMARGDGYVLFLTANDAVFSLQSRTTDSANSTARGSQVLAKNRTKRGAQGNSAVVRMQLAGANSLAKVSASNQLPGKSNYFVGNDPSKWHSDVPHFARVAYQNVYPGVNLAFHGAQRQTEFDFVVAPQANPAPIGFHFTGAKSITTDASGNLVISSTAGNVVLHKPVAYQEQNVARRLVDARFVLQANNQVSFELGTYDHNRELVIDPAVSVGYSTYLGGSGDDEAQAIALDSAGAAYVTGQTASSDFPTVAGGHSASNAGGNDVFVSKVAANGSSLVYSTYVGGSLSDTGNGIAVDVSGDAFVAGGTASTNFPTTSGVLQTALNGTAGNAFVFELSSNGNALLYSTYLGGTGKDTAFGIALASGGSGDVYVVGKSSSTNFPGTLSSVIQAHPLAGSSNSGFVAKLNSSGSALVYSTYLGGSSSGDFVGGVAVDSSDRAYVTGETFNATFVTTSGAFQTACGSCSGGNSNAFVAAINPLGTALVYSTFLGGSGLDLGLGIAADSTGNAYVTGDTTSSAFPTTSGALQPTYGGNTDAFISEVKADGSALLYSTYLGGSGFDAGASIAVDGGGNAYVTGQTNSPTPSFPTGGATQTAPGGGMDAFVSEINSAGSQVVFSTYLGGSSDEDDGGNFGAIAVDSAGANIYVTGNTASSNFPTTSGAFQTSNNGGNDAFVVKYTQPTTASFTLSATALSPSSVNPGSTATSTVTVISNNSFTGTVTLGCTVSGPTGAVHVPTCSGSATDSAAGTLTVSTTAATALLQPPANGRSSSMFYAMFLPVGGIALFGFGSKGRRRKKLFGFLLIGLVLSSLLLMPACGGGSGSSSGGGGGSPGTTAGSYAITVTGTASGASQVGASPSLTLTVN